MRGRPRAERADPNRSELIETAVQKTGLAPTDESLAVLLGTSVARIEHHRRLLGS